MSQRVLTAVATMTVAFAAVASAHASVGQLSFEGCAQGPSSASPPCVAQALDARPTDLGSSAFFLTVAGGSTTVVTSAASNTVGLLNPSTIAFDGGQQRGLTCIDDGNAGCVDHAGAALDDPVGLAALGTGGYVASGTHDAIAEVFALIHNVTIVPASTCIAEGGALGCDVAHGLHGPKRLALTPDGSQLYAATADGVAWFNVASHPGTPTVDFAPTLTFAGCLASGGADGCTDAAVGHEQAIAISPDATTVYVGSDSGTIVGLHRAADGSLTQITAVPGLQSVNGLAISPDGTSLYAASTQSGALTTLARASDGTIAQTGCLSAQSLAGCQSDADLSSVDSVGVSPDGLDVYAGDTQADAATFARAGDGSLTPAGCIGATGGACVHGATVTNPTGAITVSSIGVTVAAYDRDGVTSFRREPPTAALSWTMALTHHTATTATVATTLTNNGPSTATRLTNLYVMADQPITATSFSATAGHCRLDGIPFTDGPGVPPMVACDTLPDLAPGASITVTANFDDASNAPAPFGGYRSVFRGDVTLGAGSGNGNEAALHFRFSRPKWPMGLTNVRVRRLARPRRHPATQLRYRIVAPATVEVSLWRSGAKRRVAALRGRVSHGTHTLTLHGPHGHPLAAGHYRLTIEARPTHALAAAVKLTVRHVVFAVPRALLRDHGG